ncbi:MAG: LLM class flavin-dependent oxidoreductase [Chloroflexota bacterium]
MEQGQPRVWVAGHGPRMLRLTGQYGDGWLPFFPMSPSEYRHARSVVEAHASRAGRPSRRPALLCSWCWVKAVSESARCSRQSHWAS